MSTPNLSKSLNPAFYTIAMTKRSNILAKGGRSGTKSSAVSEILVYDKMTDPKANVLCFRQKQNTLKLSVYNQISWALYKLGIADEFNFRSNPMTILHKKWGTGFYFMGMDDPQAVKGIILPDGQYFSELWFEEADSLRGKEEIDTVQDTFTRKKLPNGRRVRTWVTYNPPKNPYHWINEWAESLADDPTWLVHHSTYLDDVRGYNSDQILDKILRYKETDFTYYEWMYLGKVVGMGDNVYNFDLFKVIDEIPSDERLLGLWFSSDTGHSQSATTTLAYGISRKGNVYLLDTDYYNPSGVVEKRSPVGHAKAINGFYKRLYDEYQVPVYQKTIDSADGATRNQYAEMYNEWLHPVKKMRKSNMIDHFIDLLAQGRFFVLNKPSNEIFLDEHKKYRWDEKSLKNNPENPAVIKVDDHTCDAMQYFVIDNLDILNIKLKK